MSDAWQGGRGTDGAPELSAEDVAARIGLEAGSSRRPDPWPPGGAVSTNVEPVRGGRPQGAARDPDRRRILWWDSATIVGGVLLSLLAVQFLGTPQLGPVAEASPTTESTGVVSGTLTPPVTLPPAETLGPVVDPSLGLDATPTPIPVITLGPTPTPTATPKVTPSPTPKITPRPTNTPSPTPAPTAAPTPAPTPTPSPTASFTWSPSALPLTIDFTDTSTGIISSWSWDFDDGNSSTEQHPSHTYLASGPYTVVLTVTGPGGSDMIAQVIAVP